jgi:aryl-alcohol dehydrogenase-like predicted oxidoreductase
VGRADRWDDLPEQRENESTWQIIDALDEVGKECGKSPSQVALNWLLQKPGVTAPIMGARTLPQLEDNLESVGWSLGPEQMARLDAASAIPLPSPYNFITRYTRRRD